MKTLNFWYRIGVKYKVENIILLQLHFLDVQIFMIGPKFPLSKTPRLNTWDASLDIDLVGISKTNQGMEIILLQ